jgi:hypothetical protein
MSPVGFEPTISEGERPQTYALDRAVTGIVTIFIVGTVIAGTRTLKCLNYDRRQCDIMCKCVCLCVCVWVCVTLRMHSPSLSRSAERKWPLRSVPTSNFMLFCYWSDDTGWGVLRAWPVMQACACDWQGRFIFYLKLTCTLCVSCFARHFAEFRNTSDSFPRSARINKLFWRDVCNIFVTHIHTHTHTYTHTHTHTRIHTHTHTYTHIHTHTHTHEHVNA